MPKDLRTEKPCERCLVVQPNDYEHFMKRMKYTRTNFVPGPICKACLSKSMVEHHKRLAQRKKDYEDFKLAEDVRKRAQFVEAERARQEAERRAQDAIDLDPNSSRERPKASD